MNESRCSNERRRLGLAYPRTCMICGLGPCGNSTSTIPPAERPLEVGSEPVAWKPTHRHAKGGLYQKIGYATVQTTSGLHDMNDAVVYQAADGTLWVRSADEFDDGRFTALPPSPQTVAERREEPDKQPSQDVPSGDASRRDEATVSIGGNAELLEHMLDTFGPSPDGAVERDLAVARSAEALPDEAVAELDPTVVRMIELGDHIGSSAQRDLLARLSRLSAELDEARAVRRWNIDRQGETLYLCRGDHERAEKCEWETFVPIERAEAAERLLASQADEIRRKDEALKPFAEAADNYDPDEGDGKHIAWANDFTIGSLRRARAALLPEGKHQEVGR